MSFSKTLLWFVSSTYGVLISVTIVFVLIKMRLLSWRVCDRFCFLFTMFICRRTAETYHFLVVVACFAWFQYTFQWIHVIACGFAAINSYVIMICLTIKLTTNWVLYNANVDVNFCTMLVYLVKNINIILWALSRMYNYVKYIRSENRPKR